MAINTISSDEKGVKIYRNEKDWNGKVLVNYPMAINGKDASGTWQKAYLKVGFKKGVDVANKSVIKINKSFLTVMKFANSFVPKLMITEFEMVEDGETFKPDDSFMEIPEGYDDMPFV